jgi:hypothetical protein
LGDNWDQAEFLGGRFILGINLDQAELLGIVNFFYLFIVEKIIQK